MADACELSRCIKRFYKYTGDPEITSITLATGELYGEKAKLDQTQLEKATADAKAAIEKRKKDGKVLKPCPDECKCKSSDKPPSNAQWVPDPSEIIRYSVREKDFPHANPQDTFDVVIHFTVREQHVDVTFECGIEEEQLGFVFGVNPESLVVLTSREVTSLAQTNGCQAKC